MILGSITSLYPIQFLQGLHAYNA